MHIIYLSSYKSARELCENKRFATKGRRLDNYTVIRLHNRDTPDEYIGIERRTWSGETRPSGTTLHPGDIAVVANIRWFTTHQRNTLIGGDVARNKRNYYVFTSWTDGKQVRADRPIKFTMGRRWRIIEGEPVPSIEKADEASREWRRLKSTADKILTVYAKLGACDPQYLDTPTRQNFGECPEYQITPSNFVAAVRAQDIDRLFKMFVQRVGWYNLDGDGVAKRVVDEYNLFYRRRRMEVLVAAGARIEKL